MARWQVLEKLGEGGYGVVFRARLKDGRDVAIKRFVQKNSPSKSSELRLEAELSRELRHPNLVALLDVQRDDDGHDCLIMELVEGVDLARLLKVARIPSSAAIYVARSLLEGLAHVHEAGIVHRDVSPHNVLISWNGEVKLTDFGIARAIRGGPHYSGAVRGKLHSLAPEQHQYKCSDVRSDLFAAGLILYQLLAGHSPYRGSDEAVWEFFRNKTPKTPLPALVECCPELSPEVCAVVMRLVEFEPADRYENTRQALDTLPACVQGQAELVAHVHLLRNLGAFESKEEPERRKRHRRLAYGMATGALLCAVGVLGTWLTSDTQPSTEPPSLSASEDAPHPVVCSPPEQASPEQASPEQASPEPASQAFEPIAEPSKPSRTAHSSPATNAATSSLPGSKRVSVQAGFHVAPKLTLQTTDTSTVTP